MAVKSVRKRQLVFINFKLPDGCVLEHPALVMSDLINDDIYKVEGGGVDDRIFYAMLISSKTHFEDRLYELRPEDFSQSPELPLKSYFVTHIVGYFTLNDVFKTTNAFLKKKPFEDLQDMFMKILGIDFETEYYEP